MAPRLESYAEVRDYLYGLRHHGAKYGIERIRLLVEELDHPERRFPCIHVAGTNGKGSVCAMLEGIFRRAGFRTGLFTSPHLVHQGERVQVDRVILSHEEIAAYTRRLVPVAERLAARDPDDHPSFFEFMTAMAFLRFAEAQVGMAIIETGLGGELDATNVVNPAASVITSISFDHMDILGSTLREIARAKAGIIKPGVPVVIGHVPPEAEEVIRAQAHERGSRVWSVRETFGEDLALYPPTNLMGDFQRINAATASLTCWAVEPSFPIKERDIMAALQEVSWPGRWDVHRLGDRTVIFDASHNPEGARGLDDNLGRLRRQDGEPPVVVAGLLGRERAAAILPVVARHASDIYLVRPKQPRASSFEEMEELIPPEFPGQVLRADIRTIFPAPGVCAVGRPGQTVVVTGSIYLLGEAMEALLHATPVGDEVLQ